MTKLNIGARIEEAYVALKVIVEKGKKSRPRTEARDMGLIGRPEETNVVHKGVEERYHGTTGEGVEHIALST